MSRPRTPEEWKAAAARVRAGKGRKAKASPGEVCQEPGRRPRLRDQLGPALRWLRKRRGLRQRELAAAAGITRPMVSAYERSKAHPKVETLERLLDALGCDLVELGEAVRMLPAVEVTPPGDLTAEELAFSRLKHGLLDWLEAMRRSALGTASGSDGGGAAS